MRLVMSTPQWPSSSATAAISEVTISSMMRILKLRSGRAVYAPDTKAG